jgi:hypothetical protein
MANTVRQSRDRLVAAEDEISAAIARGFVQRPAALAFCQFEQWPRLPALHRPSHDRFGDARAVAKQNLQQRPPARCALAPGPRRTRAPRPAWRAHRTKAEPVDLANDGVTRHPDLGGDLAASQSVDNKMSELFDALRRPSFNAHGNGLASEAAAFRPPAGEGPRNGHCAGAGPKIARRIGEQGT